MQPPYSTPPYWQGPNYEDLPQQAAPPQIDGGQLIPRGMAASLAASAPRIGDTPGLARPDMGALPGGPMSAARIALADSRRATGEPGSMSPPLADAPRLNPQQTATSNPALAEALQMDAPRMPAAPDYSAYFGPPGERFSIKPGELPQSGRVNRDTRKAIAPKFLEKGGAGEKILKGLGEFALQYNAGRGDPAALATLQNREWDRRQKFLAEREDAIWKRDANKVQYFNSGEDRYSFDPETGEASLLLDAPQAWQEYANQFGEVGSPEWNRAAQDYVLRSSGPTAYDYDSQLEGVRQTNRRDMEDYRYKNRVSLRGVPQVRAPAASGGGRPRGGGAPKPPTQSGVMGGIMAKVAQGLPLAAGEQKLFDRWYNSGARGGGRSGGRTGTGGVREGATATDPKTGRKIRYTNGRWVPIQ